MTELDRSVFAGMSPAALQTALTNAQNALIDLQTGKQTVEVELGQGAGLTRRVRYRQTNVFDLTELIRELQACLGIRRHQRGAIGIRL